MQPCWRFSERRMACDPAVGALDHKCPYWTHMLDHLAADGAGLAGGHGAVVALLEIDADFIGGLHLELVHRGASLGDHDLAAGRLFGSHNHTLLVFGFWTVKRSCGLTETRTGGGVTGILPGTGPERACVVLGLEWLVTGWLCKRVRV